MADTPRSRSVDTVDGPEAAASYDEFYFEHYSPRPYTRDDYWLPLMGGIAQRILETIRPARVLDAGCAIGLLVEALRQRGIDAEGIDLSSYAISHVHESVRPYCRVASITDDLPDRYDLIVSIEVLEHLPPAAGAAAIANFCRHTDDVLFSSTPQHYRDANHLNVQPAEYWAEIFAEHGMYRDVEFDASFVSPWAARYRRSRDGFPRIVRQYERGYAQLSLERNELRSFAHDVQQEMARSIDRAPAIQRELDQTRVQRDAEWVTNAEVRATLVDAGRQLAEARTSLDTERHRINLQAEAAREHARMALEADRQQARVAVESEREQARQMLDAERQRMQAAIETERARIGRELADVRAALEEIYAQLNQRLIESEAFASQAASLEADLRASRHDLAQARATIHNMEQSLFWRVRKWLRRK